MDPRLEPIPSPAGHLLREFCHRVVPSVVFVAGIAAAAWLWNNRFTGTMLFGEVEPVRASISATEAGTLLRLDIDRFQQVTNGQVIGVLQIMDSEAVQSSLAVLRSELGVLRARMSLDESRNEQNVETMRVRWLEARVAVATARVALENARRERERLANLFREKITSASDMDAAEANFTALEIEVKERTELVAGLRLALDKLEAEGKTERAVDVIAESLSSQERVLEQQREQKLRAPLTGNIRALHFRAGERIPAGAVVAEVIAPRSERIVGFVRQPINLTPYPGMPVEIRTRGPRRRVVQSQILEVGSDIEWVNSPLRRRGLDNATERGIAFYVDVPADLEVHPGELVDLLVRSVPH